MLFRSAGEVELMARKAYFAKVMAKDKRSEYTAEEQAVIASIEERNKTDPVQNRRYILGTDSLGRDMLSRMVYGGRISMMVGLIGTVTALLIGIVIGSIAGYAGGKIDSFLMRFVDVMYGLFRGLPLYPPYDRTNLSPKKMRAYPGDPCGLSFLFRGDRLGAPQITGPSDPTRPRRQGGIPFGA